MSSRRIFAQLHRQARRPLRQGISSPRHAGTWSALPRGPKMLATALIGAGAAGLSLGIYNYYSSPPSPYPEEMTKHIRKALYYEGAGNDPKQAIQYYLQALEEATVQGLDQTSDRMTGLKIKIGAVYEDAGRFDSAIRVYSGLLNEIQGAMREGHVSEVERTRLLRRALGTSIKIGDLSMQERSYRDKAEPAYIWALESALRETARRNGDSTWLEEETFGGIFESVANFYYATNRPHLALPLFLKALETVKQANCHTIILMNNIASSISSQNTSTEVQENAFNWAVKARDLIVTPTPEDATECELGRCSAFYNLGMISEKLFKFEDARNCYRIAITRSRKLDPSDRVALENIAKEGLSRVDAKLS